MYWFYASRVMPAQTSYTKNKNGFTPLETEARCLPRSELVWGGPSRSLMGFTLVELLVSITLLFLVVGVGFWVVPELYRRQMASAERDTIIEVLRRARTKALTNVRQSDHGVRVNANEYALFEGSSYATRNTAYDESFLRTTGFTVGGLSEVVFRALDAYVATSGAVTISHDPHIFTVSVNSEGAILW